MYDTYERRRRKKKFDTKHGVYEQSDFRIILVKLCMDPLMDDNHPNPIGWPWG